MKNVALVLTSSLFVNIFNFLVTALVIRETTEAKASAYIYCFLVGNLVQFFGVASVERLLVRRVHEAEDRDSIDLTPYVWAALALLIGPFLIAALYFGLQSGRPDTFEAFLFAGLWALASVAFLPMSYLRARLRISFESILAIVLGGLATAIKVWMIFAGVDPKFLFLVFALEFVGMGAIALMHPMARKLKVMTGFRVAEVLETLKAAFPFVVAIGLTNIYLRASFLVFSPVLSDGEIIVLGVLGQVMTAASLIPYSLQNAGYPVLQRLTDRDAQLRALFSGMCAFCVLWGGACAIGLIALGDLLVHIVYRDVQSISILVFGLVGIYIGLQTTVNARNNLIMVKGDGGELIALHVWALISAVAVSAMFTLIPTVESFAFALVASALAGLIVGMRTKVGRAYAGELVGWARPDRTAPALLALVDGFRQK